jgi:hypothetical protein
VTLLLVQYEAWPIEGLRVGVLMPTMVWVLPLRMDSAAPPSWGKKVGAERNPFAVWREITVMTVQYCNWSQAYCSSLAKVRI